MTELDVTRRSLQVGDIGGAATGDVQTWTLNRPEVRNALNPTLVEHLRASLKRAQASGTRVVLLKGNGPSFCAGADLKYLQSYGARDGSTPRGFLGDIWDLTLEMEQSDIVFVAALHGHAIAGGLELALACDVVIAAHGTIIGDGHIRHGLLPGGGGSARMERFLGRSTSTWLSLTGQFLPADDPRLNNWLRAVVHTQDLDSICDATVRTLLAAPADTQRRFKHLLHAQHPPATVHHKQRELDAFDRNWLDNDIPSTLRRFTSKNRTGIS